MDIDLKMFQEFSGYNPSHAGPLNQNIPAVKIRMNRDPVTGKASYKTNWIPALFRSFKPHRTVRTRKEGYKMKNSFR